MPLQIRVIGAHSTGKSTLTEWIASRYEIRHLPELAREILEQSDETAESIRRDPALSDRFQREVLARQYIRELEGKEQSWVTDRSIDNIVYGLIFSPGTFGPSDWSLLTEWAARIRTGITLFCRPHQSLLTSDEIRTSADWVEINRIDAGIEVLLGLLGIPFHEITSPDFSARIEDISRLIDSCV